MGYQKQVGEYLAKIDRVIENGSYKDTWESLYDHPIPKWYCDGKFGIFIHWGVYSVPAFANEWYPRNMYVQGTREFEHHVKTYGPHSEFGYKDFIPMFKAESFDPADWMRLFKESGAKYVMPVAEHHDGFQMYDSSLSDWCAAKMGPCRDVLGELKREADREGITFCASSHRAENYWFYNGSRAFDSGITGDGLVEPYGFRDSAVTETNAKGAPASREHLENWLARTCELVDKYQPSVMWFDWWIQNYSFKPYLKKFAAYYYNRALEWGREVAVNYKDEAFAYSDAVLDIERGQLSQIRPRFWQCDTATAKNSWGYTENNDFKKPNDIVCDLVDIVSKNGSMLLNIGPKPDGTITTEDRLILTEIGRWLKTNGESIYGTTYWQTFGEGPTEVKEGAFTDTQRTAFTSEDIRFTYRAPYVYANVLKWPGSGEISIKSLGSNKFKGFIKDVSILGIGGEVEFAQNDNSLDIKTSATVKTDYPVCLKITID